MNDEAASLDRLHDIVLPGPVPWWPPAPGWWWLIGLLSFVFLVLFVRAFARWQSQTYRREALRELTTLQSQLSAENAARIVPAISVLLKRAALTAWSREEVASLTGAEWLNFLDRTSGTTDFSRGPGRMLQSVGSPPGAGTDEKHAVGDLVRVRALWLRTHRREDSC